MCVVQQVATPELHLYTCTSHTCTCTFRTFTCTYNYLRVLSTTVLMVSIELVMFTKGVDEAFFVRITWY